MKKSLLAIFASSLLPLAGQINPNPGEGTLQGPLEADSDTTYFVYLPKDLNPGLKSPVMIWTTPDGANEQTLAPFYEAADTLGIIIASPVEARLEGSLTLLNNRTHVSDVLTRLEKNLRINLDAVHFGGERTGGAAAFNHSVCMKSCGTFTVSAFLTPEIPVPVCKGHHFMAGQTNSIHRYQTAWSAEKFGDNATHSLYEGTREMPSSLDITTGMIWMYSQALYKNSGSREAEVIEFERRMRPWLNELATNSPNDAAFVIRTLGEECDPKDGFKNDLDQLQAKISRDPKTTAHLAARDALDAFSEKELARYGTHYSPLANHTTKRLQRAATKLAAGENQADDFQPIIKAAALPTHP